MSQSKSKLGIAIEGLKAIVHKAAMLEVEDATDINTLAKIAKDTLIEIQAVEVKTVKVVDQECSQCGEVGPLNPCTSCYITQSTAADKA